MTLFTLADLAQLTQELLNDPNLKHKNVAEKAAIFGHAATVLGAQRCVEVFEQTSETMTLMIKAHQSDLDDTQPSSFVASARLVDDELVSMHRAGVTIPAWTVEELEGLPFAQELGDLCKVLNKTLTLKPYDGLAGVNVELESLAELGITSLPTWSARPDLAELHRRLEWALATIKDQSSQ